jgi:hypothetical protein
MARHEKGFSRRAVTLHPDRYLAGGVPPLEGGPLLALG